LTSETRYFRSDTHTVNGLTAYKLLTTNTTTAVTVSIVNPAVGHIGIRVWKRSASGVETEITSGNAVAVALILGTINFVQVSGSWSCPQTTLSNTDAIVVRVYLCDGSGGSQTLFATFITEQLGASQLDSATWTVYYWARIYGTPDTGYSAQFAFGSATRDSRIVNFTWSVPPPPPTLPKIARLGANITVQPHAIILVKRNGDIIAYRKPHMPFKPERPIQPVVS